MSKKDPYASQAETQALVQPDTRTNAVRKLAKMMAERGANEQGAEAYLILRQIALGLLADQPALRVVDCHATGACVQSGLRAEQPAQQELVYIQLRHKDEDGFSPWGQPLDPKHRHDKWAAGVEMRLLYTSPQPAHQEPVAWMDDDGIKEQS